MKKTIKVTQKYLDAHGITMTPEEIEGAVVKRIHYDGAIDEVLPHDQDGFSVGVISAINVDSDGDIVDPKGLDFSRYEKNPVVLFNHDINRPIGFAENVTVTDEKVVGKTKYASTPFAQSIHQLVKDKVLRTHSIGVIPLEAVVKGELGFQEELGRIMAKFPEKFQSESVQNIDRIIKRGLVIEYSIVTIPANEDAVMIEVKALTAEPEPEIDPETEGVVEPEPTPEPEPEPPPRVPVIKIIRRPSRIRQVSTKAERELEAKKKMYQKMWGV